MTIYNTNQNNTLGSEPAPTEISKTEISIAKKGKDKNNSKLVKGILAGAVVGGLVTLFDRKTRNQVKDSAVNLKDSSVDVFTQVKENPGEVKNQMVSQFKSAADSLKDAINEAKKLYDRLNADVMDNVNDVVQISNDTLSTAKDAQKDLASIGSKVKEAGSELTGGSETNRSGSKKAPETPETHTSIPGSNVGKF
ncbi:YtxH domain-containing protein [Bacillus sp. V2I10]|uniref:YtxH domain-containing protein n=1 Tax=Bacillus sp. V2I10 TaxID=3042276 RepID=UPI00278B0861|nr:YtxH domain-containing protein [Bacillus sp. V2I10]MDQ0859209.1 gas vesicle protein [Bacillus sp. V2I10]